MSPFEEKPGSFGFGRSSKKKKTVEGFALACVRSSCRFSVFVFASLSLLAARLKYQNGFFICWSPWIARAVLGRSTARKKLQRSGGGLEDREEDAPSIQFSASAANNKAFPQFFPSTVLGIKVPQQTHSLNISCKINFIS